MPREYITGSARSWANGRVTWMERDASGGKRMVSVIPATIPEDAPQEAWQAAAQQWTPEVIQFAKDRLAGAKPKEE